MNQEPGRMGARRGRPVTIKDVARLSGFSQATVTRALNDSPRVRPETRQKIEEACEVLGYRPHSLARALVTGTSNTIGLLMPSIGDAFWGAVAAGVEERAGEENLAVLLANSQGNRDREKAMVELFLSKSVDGIIVGAALGNPLDWLKQNDQGMPVVVIGWDERLPAQALSSVHRLPVEELADWPQMPEADSAFQLVNFDDREAGAHAGRHLVELGHTRCAFVGGAPSYSAVRRIIGFRQALNKAGLEPTAIIDTAESLEAGQAAALELLARDDRPTAIFAYSDIVAIGVMRGARAMGLSVPGGVSIVGVDDIDMSGYVEPPLTTIRQPKAEIGSRAVAALLSGSGDAAFQTLPGELIRRNSTGPPS